MISLIVLLLEFYLPFNICWQKRLDLKKLFFKPTFIKTLTNIVVYKIVWKSWEWQTRLQFNFVTWAMNSNKVADFVFIQSLFISHFQVPSSSLAFITHIHELLFTKNFVDRWLFIFCLASRDEGRFALLALRGLTRSTLWYSRLGIVLEVKCLLCF